MGQRTLRWTGAVVGLVCLSLSQACNTAPTLQTVNVTLKNTAVFQFPSGTSGDEEGINIVQQASHFRVSEVHKDAATNFVATYIYQPADGYVGTDTAEIEVVSNAVGTGPADVVQKLRFVFQVTQ